MAPYAGTVVVPIEPYSDGDPQHRPNRSDYALQDPPTIYLEKLAESWMKERGEYQKGKMSTASFFLPSALPGCAVAVRGQRPCCKTQRRRQHTKTARDRAAQRLPAICGLDLKDGVKRISAAYAGIGVYSASNGAS